MSHARSAEGSGPRIVVGFDGSEDSVAALRWARTEAVLRGAVLEVVHAWALPAAIELDEGADDRAWRELEERARDWLGAAVEDSLTGDADDAGLPAGRLQVRVTAGQPAQVLVQASETADLLVVGTRGHGGFASLLLGSVSSQCVHHARCPVAVVPPPRRVR